MSTIEPGIATEMVNLRPPVVVARVMNDGLCGFSCVKPVDLEIDDVRGVVELTDGFVARSAG